MKLASNQVIARKEGFLQISFARNPDAAKTTGAHPTSENSVEKMVDKQMVDKPFQEKKYPPESSGQQRLRGLLGTEPNQKKGVDNFASRILSPLPNISQIHAALINAGYEKYCCYDKDAIVLSQSIGSEHEQKLLINATIDSADKFAIITTYAIRPLKGKTDEQISDTMFAVLEALAKRQNDNDFSFVFLYQKSSSIQNFILRGKRTEISMNNKQNEKGTPSWPQVIDAYNIQQKNENLKLKDLKCNVYLIAAEPKGIGGSHHNKFCINDNGVAATLGASIGNRTKDDWYDSGYVVLSQKLSRSQVNYFCDELLPDSGHFGQLKVQEGISSIERLENLSKISNLSNLPVNNPIEASGDGIDKNLEDALEGLNSGSRTKGQMLWLQNPSHGYRNMFTQLKKIDKSPIGRAFCLMLNSAQVGDTLKIRNNRLDKEACSLLISLLKRGVNVSLLKSAPEFEKLKTHAPYFQEKYEKLAASSDGIGKLTIRYFSPNEEFARTHNCPEALVSPFTHGKVYILERPGQPSLVMTGTYNLDGQSHYRSSENMMVLQTNDHRISESLFDEAYIASEKSENAV